MYPIVLDLSAARAAVAGNGPAAARRLAGLDAAGAAATVVFADRPCPQLRAAAGARLVRRLPTPEDLIGLRVLLVAGLAEPEAGRLAAMARQAGVLVNVEDRKPLCDFHLPAVVRRGDLTVTVSTGGRSPGLAARLRRYLEDLFGPEWGDRLEEVSARRAEWRRRGAGAATVRRRTERFIGHRDWLD